MRRVSWAGKVGEAGAPAVKTHSLSGAGRAKFPVDRVSKSCPIKYLKILLLN